MIAGQATSTCLPRPNLKWHHWCEMRTGMVFAAIHKRFSFADHLLCDNVLDASVIGPAVGELNRRACGTWTARRQRGIAGRLLVHTNNPDQRWLDRPVFAE